MLLYRVRYRPRTGAGIEELQTDLALQRHLSRQRSLFPEQWYILESHWTRCLLGQVNLHCCAHGFCYRYTSLTCVCTQYLELSSMSKVLRGSIPIDEHRDLRRLRSTKWRVLLRFWFQSHNKSLSCVHGRLICTVRYTCGQRDLQSHQWRQHQERHPYSLGPRRCC